MAPDRLNHQNLLIHRLRPALFGLGLTLIAGTGGYMVIEGWSVADSAWMLIITLTTIGYGEVHPLTPTGRLFTVLVITVGFGLVGYTFSQITRYVLEGGLAHDISLRQRRTAMQKLHDHYIVVGYGRLGREVVAELLHKGLMVCVIDQSEEVLADLPEPAVALVGDGTSDALLHEAAVTRARGVAISTPHSATNVYVTLAVRQLAPECSIITRVDDEDAEEKARRAGASRIIRPFAAGGSRMATSLVHPETSTFFENVATRHDATLDMRDVRISASAGQVQGRLRELGLRQRYGILVVAIRHPNGELETSPHPDTLICTGDVLVVVGRHEDVEAFHKLSAEVP